MGSLLIHHPLVQFYLFYVGALLIAVTWDQLRTSSATRDESKRPSRSASGSWRTKPMDSLEAVKAATMPSRALAGTLALRKTRPTPRLHKISADRVNGANPDVNDSSFPLGHKTGRCRIRGGKQITN